MLAYDYPLLGVFWPLLALFMFVLVGFVVIYTFVDNSSARTTAARPRPDGRC